MVELVVVVVELEEEVVVEDDEDVVVGELVVVEEVVVVEFFAQSVWARLRTLFAPEVRLPLRPASTDDGSPVTRSWRWTAASVAAVQSPAATAVSTSFRAESKLLA